MNVVDLARELDHRLRECGEVHPVPLLGGFVVRGQADGRVRISWHLPGPPAFGGIRRRRVLRRYARLLREWGFATELRLDHPEPHVTCWMTEPYVASGCRDG